MIKNTCENKIPYITFLQALGIFFVILGHASSVYFEI